MLIPLAFIPARLFLVVDKVEPVSLGPAAIRVFVVSLLIAVVGFGVAFWLKQKNAQVGKASSKTKVRSFLKGKNFGESSDDLNIVSSKRVGPGQLLVDVDWQGRRILLGCTANGISCLSEDNSSDEFTVESEA